MPKATKPRDCKIVGTTMETGQYKVTCCPGGCHVQLKLADPSGLYTFTPEEAHDFAQALLRGYDAAAGVK